MDGFHCLDRAQVQQSFPWSIDNIWRRPF